MKKPHYAWIVCAGCTLLLFCNTGLMVTAFSVYQPFIIEVNGFTNTQASTLLTIKSISSLIAMLLAGFYFKRLGARIGITIAVTVAACAFIIYGLSTSYPAYCAASVLGGIAYSFGGMIPASMVLGRWFADRRGLALGICAAGSGLSAFVSPPIVTFIIEKYSLYTSFIVEGLFILLCAAVIFIIVRDTPESKGLSAYTGGRARQSACEAEPAAAFIAGRGQRLSMLLAFVLIGAVANPGFGHLSILYSSEGMDSGTVAFVISFAGIVLTAAKCLFGLTVDRIGAYKSNYLFFALLITGTALCCAAGSASVSVALAAMFCVGAGLPISTVGLSVYAGDMSSAEDYSKTVKHFQIAYMVGAIAFGSFPGIIADITGSYVPAYVMFSAFSAIAMRLIQRVYKLRHESILSAQKKCLQ